MLDKFAHKQTGGFTVLGILSDRPYNPAWRVDSESQEERAETRSALKQKYSYFGCGGQSFIFFSEDDKYVIKVFKQRKFQVPLWIKMTHIPWLLDRFYEKKLFRRKDKLERDFISYKIAFDELKAETALLAVHLNKTNDLKQKIHFVDKLNISHFVDADSLDFVIQRRADLVHTRISSLMRAGKIEEAKNSVSRILQLIVTRCEKGFQDRDPNIRTNCGFAGDQPIKIDVGRFIKNESMKRADVKSKELQRIAKPFGIWLLENYPALFDHFHAEIHRLSTDV
jgi:hypothetical protein